MIDKTSNPYKFKYLQIGFKGISLEHVYLPPQPAYIATRNNKWERQGYPENWSKWNKEEKQKGQDYSNPEKQEFVERQWEYRNKGFWFMNNDQPTYITGLHWFYLTWWKQTYGYADFRDTDKELFYFIEYCDKDPNCYGMIFNTVRRFGKSSIMACWGYEHVTKTENAHLGMQGENVDKIKAFYSNFILYAHNFVPDFFSFDTERGTGKGIKFKDNTADSEDKEYIGSLVTYTKSSEKAYDGFKLRRYICEEPGKTSICDVSERHDVVKPCVLRGTKIWGKMMYATTVEDMEGAGKSYEKLFFDSDFGEKSEIGQTKSGLYSVFIPGDLGIDYDDFGFPMQESNLKWIMANRKQMEGDDAKLSAWIRKYPLSIKEVFSSYGKNSIYNSNILNNRLAEIRGLKSKPYSNYNLIAQEGIYGKGTFIEAFPEKKGRFHISKMPEDGAKNSWSKNPDGSWKKSNVKYVIGIDPIDYSEQVTKGSNPAAVVMRLYDSTIDGQLDEHTIAMNKEAKYPYKTGIPVAYYLYRPSDPHEFYDDMIKLGMFYGAEIHIESNRPGLIEYMKRKGLAGVLTKRYRVGQALKKFEPYGTPSSDNLIDEYVRITERYIWNFGYTIPFDDLLNDLLLYDRSNTTKFDLAVAFGFALLAVEKHSRREEFQPIENAGFIRIMSSQPYIAQ